MVIHSSIKALAFRVSAFLEGDGRMATIQLTKKMYRDATASHPYTSKQIGNYIEVVQSKVIQK